MARPNLSSLVSKFLFRETLTSEEKGSLRSDIAASSTTGLQAETAARIAGDQSLSTALSNEVQARIAGDAAIIRPFEDGDPSVPQAITITGELGGRVFPSPLNAYPYESSDGRPQYYDDSGVGLVFYVYNGPQGNSFWQMEHNDPTIGVWRAGSDALTPDLVPTGPWDAATNPDAWRPHSSGTTGTPIVTAEPVPQGSFIGQQLRWEQAAAGTYKWYIWSGATWTELALA